MTATIELLPGAAGASQEDTHRNDLSVVRGSVGREIQRFMLVFGPLSSIFDFLTFAILLAGLHAGAPEFRSGWFVESLATQTLVVFVIRTHNAFWRSRPSTPLVASVLGVVVVATVLPYSPLASPLGFTRLPATFLGVLVVLVAAYLMLIEGAKRLLFAPGDLRRRAPRHRIGAARRVHRRAARFTARSSDRHNPRQPHTPAGAPSG